MSFQKTRQLFSPPKPSETYGEYEQKKYIIDKFKYGLQFTIADAFAFALLVHGIYIWTTGLSGRRLYDIKLSAFQINVK